MANYQARGVKLETFDGAGKVATDLPGPSGNGADALKGSIEAFSHLSGFLNTWADKAAASEGAEAGTAAALAQGDNLQLRKDGTLTGEAFDKAAIDTRSAQLDTAVRNDLFDQAQKFKGDPQGMKAAFDQVNASYADQAGLSPELQAHFDKRFSDLRFSYETAAVRERDNDVRATAAASYGTAIDTARRDAAKTAFILGNDPGADDKIAAESGRIKRMVANAAEAGYITPANAAKVTTSLDTDLAEQKVRGTFDRLQGIEAKQTFLDQINKDWREGKALKNFGPDEFQSLRASLTTGINQERSLQNQQAATLKSGITSIRGRVLDGYGVSEAEWGELEAVAQRSNSPELQKGLQVAKAEVAQIGQWWSMKPDDLAAAIHVEQARVAGDATTNNVATLKAAQSVYATMSKEAASDPISLAQRTGRAAPTALEPTVLTATSDLANALFSQRAAAAEHAAGIYGVAPKYFLATERDQWAKIFNAGGDPANAAAKLFTQQWGEATALKAIAEIADKAGVMAHAAAVTATGGSADFSNDVARALAYRGMQGYTAVALKAPQVASAVSDEYGAAFTAAPAAAFRATEAAKAAYDARARDQNLPAAVDHGEGKKVFRKTLQEAAGASFDNGVQYGGITDINGRKTLIPPDVKASRAGDLIGAITDADLAANPPIGTNGKPLRASDLRGAALVAIGPGRYRVAAGDPASDRPQWFADGSGGPWVLDLGAMAPSLRARRPDIYRGTPEARRQDAGWWSMLSGAGR